MSTTSFTTLFLTKDATSLSSDRVYKVDLVRALSSQGRIGHRLLIVVCQIIQTKECHITKRSIVSLSVLSQLPPGWTERTYWRSGCSWRTGNADTVSRSRSARRTPGSYARSCVSSRSSFPGRRTPSWAVPDSAARPHRRPGNMFAQTFHKSFHLYAISWQNEGRPCRRSIADTARKIVRISLPW